MDRKVSREEPVEKEKEETVINKYNVGKNHDIQLQINNHPWSFKFSPG